MRVLAGIVVLGGMVGSLSAVALTSEQIVGQRGRTFSVENLTIKQSQPVTFLNDDSVPHNVVSLSKGNEFDLGSQPPGTSTAVKFTVVGQVNVICAIHPRMKMVINVTN